MPDFEITSPDGRKFVVTAPEGASQSDILAYAQKNMPPVKKTAPYQSSVWPLSIDENGKVHFPDFNAGIIGALKDAIMAPGDALKGKLRYDSPEAYSRAFNLAMLVNPAPAAYRAGERIPGEPPLATVRPKAPSADQLRDAASAGYNAVRDSGVSYSGEAVKNFADSTINDLNQKSFFGKLAPKTHAVLDELSRPPEGGFAGIDALDAARKTLGKLTDPKDRTEAAAATIAIANLDKFMGSAGPDSLMAGSTLPVVGGAANPGLSTTQAADLLKQARGNSAAAFRSDRLTGIDEAANLRAAAANSGQNLGNNLRSRAATLLLDENATRGFTEKELTALKQVVEGSATTNTLRYVSNLLGGGGGIGQTGVAALGATIGAASGGAPGAAIGATLPPLMGATARTVGNKLTERQLLELAMNTRMRSPLYNQMLANAPQKVPYELPQMLMRAYLSNILRNPVTADQQ